jgi:hypothetical protein
MQCVFIFFRPGQVAEWANERSCFPISLGVLGVLAVQTLLGFRFPGQADLR